MAITYILIMVAFSLWLVLAEYDAKRDQDEANRRQR